MKTTYFTLDNEGKHIATIAAVNEQELHEKVLTALEEEFDSEVIVSGEFDFSKIVNHDPNEFKAYVDGDLNMITIQQTWLY